MTRIRTAVAMLAIALAIPAAVAGCGGGSDNDENPDQVLEQTFNNDTKITSGTLDVSLGGSAEGDQSGDFSVSISGPFESDPNDETAFPQFDLTANVNASGGGPSFSFDGSLVATKDNAYVEYQDQAYEVGTDTFEQFTAAYAQQAKQNQKQQKDAQNVFSQFGVDPQTWLTNVTNEGTTDVDGTETIQIHGDADIAKIFTDLQKISKQTGGTTQQITPDQLKLVEDAVGDASIDVYSGVDDHLLRKLSVSLDITPPEDTGAQISSANVDFSITLGDVNDPQTITAPQNPKPIEDLLQQFGLPGLPGSTGGFDLPGGSASGSGGASSAYLDCVQSAAGDPQKVEACADKL